ncbi:HAD family hydrolase [Ekhidna sp. To15]|uniref:HAD family hydrolase n=1 Tax=Ekhidna sp. To15 TaxID=3395267 RepID=UPI003F51B0EB
MIKAIFFDVANTLLHKPDLMANIQEAFQKFGYSFVREQIQAIHQQLTEEVVFPDETTQEFYNGFNAKLCQALQVETSPLLVQNIYEVSRGLEWHKFDDLDIIEQLSLPIGIASNWDKSLQEKLKHYFSYDFKWILISEELGVKKPQPEFFSQMIDTSGYQASEIMFVGDSMHLDIVPAKEMGIEAVLLDRNNFYSTYEGKKIKSMNELTSLL